MLRTVQLAAAGRRARERVRAYDLDQAVSGLHGALSAEEGR